MTPPTPITGSAAYRAESHERPGMPLPGVAAVWFAPVLLTLMSAANNSIVAMTTVAAAVCAGANVLRPRSIVVTLPFFALLSPMTGLLDFGGARLVYSDLLFALLSVQVIWLVGINAITQRPRIPTSLSVLAILVLMSVVVGLLFDRLVSLKPALYLIQLAIVALLTSAFATERDDWLSTLRAWLTATCFGALIMLQAYAEGRPLDYLKEPDADLGLSVDPLSLFRATYYYGGFHYTLGLGMVWVATRLFFPARWYARISWFGVFALLALALVATVNKTAIAAVAVAVLISASALFLRFPKEMTASITWLAVLGTLGLLVASWQYLILIENTQLELILDRLFSVDSLLIRFDVYIQAVEVWLSSGWGVPFGFGADFLDNSGNEAYSVELKAGKSSGYVEGTLDSAWLSYMVELGLPAFLLLAGALYAGLRKSAANLRHCARFDDGAYAHTTLLGGLIFLGLAMTTQMLGYTKTAWLPLQILLVAMVGLRHGVTSVRAAG